jgi:signal transduction histidine kinase
MSLMMSAVIVGRRGMEEALRRSEERYRSLSALGQKLNGATSAEDAGQIITDAAEKLFGWDACFIYLCDENQHALFPIINVDTIDEQKVPVPPIYVGTPPSALAGEVMSKGSKLILRKPPFEFSGEANAFGDKKRASASLMFAPIREAEKVFGLFSIQSYTPNAYTDKDLATLQSLADYCGGALRRIQATEELRAAKEQLGRQAAELEKRVAERTAELKETIESLESFCYTIAHDLRAPLRSLQGFTTALVDDYAPQMDAVGQDFCRRIVGSARHMDQLIQDLLSYGQLMHKDLPIGAVNLELVIEDSLSQLTEEIKSRNAEVEVKHPLPGIRGNTIVLEQVICNLVSNALKFVPSKTQPRIRISTEEKPDKIRICVCDNGIGIPREHHERIFRVFERLHNSTAYPGTGVGLAIVRKGVERMGGIVGLESEPGTGSTFWMELSKADGTLSQPNQLVQTALNLAR